MFLLLILGTKFRMENHQRYFLTLLSSFNLALIYQCLSTLFILVFDLSCTFRVRYDLAFMSCFLLLDLPFSSLIWMLMNFQSSLFLGVWLR